MKNKIITHKMIEELDTPYPLPKKDFKQTLIHILLFSDWELSHSLCVVEGFLDNHERLEYQKFCYTNAYSWRVTVYGDLSKEREKGEFARRGFLKDLII